MHTVFRFAYTATFLRIGFKGDFETNPRSHVVRIRRTGDRPAGCPRKTPGAGFDDSFRKSLAAVGYVVFPYHTGCVHLLKVIMALFVASCDEQWCSVTTPAGLRRRPVVSRAFVLLLTSGRTTCRSFRVVMGDGRARGPDDDDDNRCR